MRCDRCGERAVLKQIGLTLFNDAGQPSAPPGGACVGDLCPECIAAVVAEVDALLSGSPNDGEG